MQNHNLRPSDRAGVLAAISPVSQAAGTVSTPWIAMADQASLTAIVQAGVLGAAATLDAKFEQATSSAGAGAKDVTGRAMTQLTKAGSDDNKQAIINLGARDLDFANGFTHVRLSVTVGVAASLMAAMVIGMDQRAGVASDAGAASVDEIVG